MAHEEEDFKDKLARKLLEFRKQGLESYGRYLEKEWEKTPKTELKKYYLRYIKKELSDNARRLKKISEKLEN